MNYEKLKGEFRSVPEKEIEFLRGKTLFVTGGTGLIGSFLLSSILCRKDFPIDIHLIVFNKEKDPVSLGDYRDDPRIHYIEQDVRKPMPDIAADYYISAASMTDPLQYSTRPVETIEINVLGAKNVLDVAKNHPSSKVLAFSSCEIYGVLDSTSPIQEKELGYLNLSDPRSCYNESKRLVETMCACYAKEHGVHYSVVRLSRVYGPTMRIDDAKALAQFLRKGIAKEDIVLKSKGEQLFDYLYVADAVVGILTVLRDGGQEAYNLSTEPHMTLRELAEFIASYAGTKVRIELPSELEAAGYSRIQTSVMDSTKIQGLGFKASVSVEDGIRRTLDILSE